MPSSLPITAPVFLASAMVALSMGCGSSQKDDVAAHEHRDAGMSADTTVRADSPTSPDVPTGSDGRDVARGDAVGVVFDAPLGTDSPSAADGAQAMDVVWAGLDSAAQGIDVALDTAPEAQATTSDGAAPAEVGDRPDKPADVSRDMATITDSSAKKTDLPAGAQSIPDYQVMQIADFPYQCFVKSWDDERYPVFYALIQSASDFDAYFGAAGVMGASKPYTPSAEDFSKNSYILVSRVVPASPVQKTFRVDALMAGGGEVGLFYTFKLGDGSSTGDAKEGILVAFPKRKIDQVVVYQNQVPLGILDTASGKNDVTQN